MLRFSLLGAEFGRKCNGACGGQTAQKISARNRRRIGQAVPQHMTNPLPVETTNVIVLENDLLPIELLPDFGAKICGIHHKPAGREILWRNPSIPPRRPELAPDAVIDAEVARDIGENKAESSRHER